MKTNTRFLIVALALVSILLNACARPAAPAAPASPAQSSDSVGAKVQAVKVAYTGVVERMDGSQWVVNSQNITVDPSVVLGGPFKVGDTIKIEGQVQADGSIRITRIEMPAADDLAASSSIPSVPSSDLPAGITFDDDGNEAWGVVEAITAESITVSGQTFSFATGAEIKGLVVIGSFVKLEFLVNPDGSLSVREVKLADPSDIGDDDNDDNGNDDNGNENDNDDNGNENDNDDNGNENDDNGNENDNDDDGNENDDNGNDDNSNDDDNEDDNDDDNSNDDDNEDDDDDGDDDNEDDNDD